MMFKIVVLILLFNIGQLVVNVNEGYSAGNDASRIFLFVAVIVGMGGTLIEDILEAK